MQLTREVLPPRQAPGEVFTLLSEAQLRSAITWSVWMSVTLVGLANVVARLLETQL